MGGARRPGGIQGLRELAESYPDELVWELHKLGLDVDDIGDDEDSTAEQIAKAVDHVKVDRLLRVATRDPSSVLYAAQHGWDFPVTREWIATADLYDAVNQLIQVTAQSKRKPKPYPRPWPDSNTARLGKTNLSPADAREVLRKNKEGLLHAH
ncbi:hypothetical protein NY588_09555 [Curtobacterium flaccumfaciens pv. beticola]|uniref:hypothetical protein n=1 Tax=Curtobacterium flaccumfaciens TaxID=2035 RepID=UPI00349F64CB|nr:hypothetical protein [Curtobacterium flaccumfaciens pv. basellae]